MHTELWLENLEGVDHLEDVGVVGSILLDSSSWRKLGNFRLVLSGTSDGFCKLRNDHFIP